MLMIEVLESSGTDTDRKKGLVVALVENLVKQASTQTTSWCSFWKPIVRADHSAAAGSHHLLPSLDQ